MALQGQVGLGPSLIGHSGPDLPRYSLALLARPPRREQQNEIGEADIPALVEILGPALVAPGAHTLNIWCGVLLVVIAAIAAPL